MDKALRADGYDLDLLVIKNWPIKDVRATRKLLQGGSISLPTFPSLGQQGAGAAGDAQEVPQHLTSYSMTLASPLEELHD